MMRGDALLHLTRVDVWRANLMADQPAEDVAENLQLLSPHEHARAARFLSPELRANYIERRSVLRRLLAGYLQQHPADIVIDTTEFGKPFLGSPADAWLCFSVACSNTQILVAIGRNRRIGVDIERISDDLDYSEIISNYFAADEQAEIARLPAPDRLRTFFNCWTRKEAYLKATGRGLSAPLDSLVVSASPKIPGAFFKVAGDPSGSDWTLRDVPVAPGYAAAVSAEGKVLELSCMDYVRDHWTDTHGGARLMQDTRPGKSRRTTVFSHDKSKR